jgi:spectinomycin phosphotransferase
VLTRPDDLSDQQVAEALRAWGLSVDEIAYVPLGFGSHHWRVTADGRRWFVNVDDVEAKRRVNEPVEEPLRRLDAALSTAWSLRDAGLEFVVAPVRTPAGAIVEVLNQRFAAALYPHVDGESRSWGPYLSRAERLSVLELIADLHQSTDAARSTALTDDLRIDSRDQLVVALDELDTPWTGGPYAEPARALLRPRADLVGRALGHYDELAAAVIEQHGRMVVTHGEPHRGNTMATPSGVMLIDWDTVQIAPPERDLWSLVAEDPSIAAAYSAITGKVTNPESIELYRLRWILTDIALFIADFRRDHRDTEDTRTAMSGLSQYLDPALWTV